MTTASDPTIHGVREPRAVSFEREECEKVGWCSCCYAETSVGVRIQNPHVVGGRPQHNIFDTYAPNGMPAFVWICPACVAHMVMALEDRAVQYVVKIPGTLAP